MSPHTKPCKPLVDAMNTSPADTLAIINPAAARAALVWRDIRQTLADQGIRIDEHTSRAPGDGAARAREGLRSGYGTILAAGGDGTLSEIASGFFTRGDDPRSADGLTRIAHDAALAIIPSGTGDDFARSLAGGRAPIRDWIERFIRHAREQNPQATTHTLDVLDGAARVPASSSVNRFVCINAATLGIGAEVAARVAAQGEMLRRANGEARFAVAALGALARWRDRLVRVSVDGASPIECRTNLLAVMNNPYAGGGMMFAPGARPDDGALDVVTTDRLTRLVLVRELARIHRGGHVANPSVRVLRGRRVLIETEPEQDALSIEADGDIRGTTPVELRVVPNALRVVV